MSIDLKYVELTADVLEVFFTKCIHAGITGMSTEGGERSENRATEHVRGIFDEVSCCWCIRYHVARCLSYYRH